MAIAERDKPHRRQYRARTGQELRTRATRAPRRREVGNAFVHVKPVLLVPQLAAPREEPGNGAC
eukprot:scaffold447_cov384-Prasinococcus_capsulatus_cf.AAC.7